MTVRTVVDEVTDLLRRQAEQKEQGERLPPVRELMATYGVSQFAVQKAIETLKNEGVVSAHVGRGIFVGPSTLPQEKQRNILVLTRELRTDRSDEFARNLHQEMLQRNWRSAVLTYSDFAQPLDLLRNAPAFDACVIHPRQEIVPLELLSALRSRSRAVVIEGYSATGIDVDSVAVDWRAAVSIGLRHLIDMGHRKVGLVTTDRPTRASAAVSREFRLLHHWAGLDALGDPVLAVPDGTESEVYDRIAQGLKAQMKGPGRSGCTALMVHLGALHGKRFLGALRRVSSDISIVVIGFTNLDFEHSGHLTTVGQSTTRVVERVALTIEKRWSAPGTPYESHYLEPELLVRNSTLRKPT